VDFADILFLWQHKKMERSFNMGNIMNWDSTIWAQKDTEQKVASGLLKESEQPRSRKDLEVKPKAEKKMEVPIWHKASLTLEETAAYSGIGINKLREITDKKDCNFVLFIGRKRLIKRRQFEEYLAQRCVI
jgi:excisionase family DNA binding protein